MDSRVWFCFLNQEELATSACNYLWRPQEQLPGVALHPSEAQSLEPTPACHQQAAPVENPVVDHVTCTGGRRAPQMPPFIIPIHN